MGASVKKVLYKISEVTGANSYDKLPPVNMFKKVHNYENGVNYYHNQSV